VARRVRIAELSGKKLLLKLAGLGAMGPSYRSRGRTIER
jgi:hypothetical protein